MSQVHKSAIAQPIRVQRSYRVADFTAMLLAIAATGLASFLILTSLSSAPAGQAASGRGDLADGWMAGAATAQAARLQRVQDGFFPGLVGARGGGDPVDGYVAGLVAARSGGDLIDGWMPAFGGTIRSADVTDGWEASLLP